MESSPLLEIGFNGPVLLYATLVLGGSLFVRVAVSLIRSCRIAGANENPDFWRTFRASFMGSGIDAGNPVADNDYWIPFWIGALELTVFPALLTAGKPDYIAGWLVLKTLPQWQKWTETRHVYNQFLIGSALVLVLSYFLARNFFHL